MKKSILLILFFTISHLYGIDINGKWTPVQAIKNQKTILEISNNQFSLRTIDLKNYTIDYIFPSADFSMQTANNINFMKITFQISAGLYSSTTETHLFIFTVQNGRLSIKYLFPIVVSNGAQYKYDEASLSILTSVFIPLNG